MQLRGGGTFSPRSVMVQNEEVALFISSPVGVNQGFVCPFKL